MLLWRVMASALVATLADFTNFGYLPGGVIGNSKSEEFFLFKGLIDRVQCLFERDVIVWHVEIEDVQLLSL